MLSLLITCVVSAAPIPGEAETQRFKTSFTEGEAAYQAGEYGVAIFKFRDADHLKVTPEVAFDLAKCFERIGDVGMAAYYYRLYVARAPEAKDAFEVAGRVGALLAKAKGENKGYLELDSAGALALSIGGKRFPEPPAALFLPQGLYDVAVEFPSGIQRLRLAVKAGETTSHNYEPVPPPMVEAEAPAPEAAVDVTPVKEGPSQLRVASYVALAVGLVAAATGTVFAVSSNEEAALSRNRALTVSEAQAAAASANTKGLGANVLFGVGGGAVAAGLVMLIISIPPAAPLAPPPAEGTP